MAERSRGPALILPAIPLAMLVAGCPHPAARAGSSVSGKTPGPDEIDRRYPRGAEEVWEAVLETFQKNACGADPEDRDPRRGDLVAQRPDGGKVFVSVKKLEPKQTAVRVRLEPPDRALS